MKQLEMKSLYQIHILNEISNIKEKIRKQGYSSFKDEIDLIYLEYIHDLRAIYNEYLIKEISDTIKDFFNNAT